jgi:hypothetical protein
VRGGKVDGAPGIGVLAQGVGAVDAKKHVAGVGHVNFGLREAGVVERAAHGDGHGGEDFGRLIDFVLEADDSRRGAGGRLRLLAVGDEDARVLVGVGDFLAGNIGPGRKGPQLIDDAAAERENVAAIVEAR